MISQAAGLKVMGQFGVQPPVTVCQQPRKVAEILRGTQLCEAFRVSRPPIQGSSTRANGRGGPRWGT